MNYKNISTFILLAVLSIACSKDEIMTFSDVNRIQFGNVETITNAYDTSLEDSLQNFTFVYHSSDVTIDTAFFKVFTSGGPVNYDRYFTLNQISVEGVENAIEEVHYLPFNESDTEQVQVIKAGEVSSDCGVILLRDPSLQESKVTLLFELVASDEFHLGNEDYLRRKLTITDQLTKPNYWDASITNYHFGKYSKVKHRFMIDFTGKRWDDDDIIEVKANYSELLYWDGVLSKALLAYNNEHPNDPLKDEDGDLVEFVN